MVAKLGAMVATGVILASCHGDTITESVGGTVVGLVTGASVTLLDNGGDPVTVSKNGSFTFPTSLDVGSEYIVTVGTQPAGEFCTVENSIGIIEQNIGNVSSVVVSCISSVSASDDVNGTVTGLKAGNTLQLTNKGADTLTVTGTSASVQTWAFAQALAIGATYQVSILTQPTGQTCVINSGASGSISASQALAPVVITCN